MSNAERYGLRDLPLRALRARREAALLLTKSTKADTDHYGQLVADCDEELKRRSHG